MKKLLSTSARALVLIQRDDSIPLVNQWIKGWGTVTWATFRWLHHRKACLSTGDGSESCIPWSSAQRVSNSTQVSLFAATGECLSSLVEGACESSKLHELFSSLQREDGSTQRKHLTPIGILRQQILGRLQQREDLEDTVEKSGNQHSWWEWHSGCLKH